MKFLRHAYVSDVAIAPMTIIHAFGFTHWKTAACMKRRGFPLSPLRNYPAKTVVNPRDHNNVLFGPTAMNAKSVDSGPSEQYRNVTLSQKC